MVSLWISIRFASAKKTCNLLAGESFWYAVEAEVPLRKEVLMRRASSPTWSLNSLLLRSPNLEHPLSPLSQVRREGEKGRDPTYSITHWLAQAISTCP